MPKANAACAASCLSLNLELADKKVSGGSCALPITHLNSSRRTACPAESIPGASPENLVEGRRLLIHRTKDRIQQTIPVGLQDLPRRCGGGRGGGCC